MSYTRWFQEVNAAEVDLVGGKGANLGEMVATGLPVPPGFCVTAPAYREFIRVTGLDETIRDILAEIHLDDPVDVKAKAGRIRGLIVEQRVPGPMAQEILDGYHRLAQEQGAEAVTQVPVAVRSSATAEDLPTASFAGQQDSYLNVRGDAELLDRVKDCWASLWTDRAVVYRTRQGFDHQHVYLAVVVQAMIQSEVAGVLFTANPVTGDRDQAVINASWGLGEAIVSGLVTPDTVTVHKSDGTIVSRQTATKEYTIEYAETGGTVTLATSPEQREAPALSDQQVSELVTLGQEIEGHYGTPQDIEWAFASGRLYILQARAVTTLPPQPGETLAEEEYDRTMFVELFPDPLSPAFLSVMQPMVTTMLEFTFETLGFKPPAGAIAVGAFYNQPYFNRSYIVSALQPLSPPVRERLVSQIVNPFGRHERGIRGEVSLAYVGLVARMLRFMVSFPDRLPGLIDRYRAEVAEADLLPLDTTSDRDIVACIRNLVFGGASRLLNYDFLMIAVIGITYQVLGTLLQRYFGEDTEQLRGRLISGVTGNVTMETNKHLWDLAQVAKDSPTVTDVLRRYSEQEAMANLEQTAEGRDFLDALERFLSAYGHREIRMDIMYPTWGEDPAPVLSFVRGYLDADEAHSPHRQQARLVKERQKLTEEVQARLKEDRIGRYLVSPIFRRVLSLTQAHTRERDTMHFELTRAFPPFRRLLLELGRRWGEQGLIAQREDVFFLTFDEMVELVESPRPMHDEVRARRAEFAVSRSRPWPDIIRGDQEIYAEAGGAGEAAAGQLQGVAGSPGTVTGVARVIRGPEEFGRLQKNDILVAPLTNPVWTPLFAIAGGVITEAGGILSHGAIVAREYGIPAVMSVAGVTKRVRDGQTIVVNGNRGIVQLNVQEAAPWSEC